MNTTRCHTLTRLLFSCLLLLLLTVTVSAADTVAYGNCGAEGDGSNLTWTLDSDGVLTINGSGRMKDYSYYGCAPWYENRESVRMVNIGEGVTSIGDFAFRDCSSLTSVTIPEGVNSIGVDAFYECSNLARATIPNSVTSIGVAAFNSCSSLESVMVGKGVTSIGYAAFALCSSLTSVTIPENVTSIGESAFNGCNSLASVTIGKRVTSIGERAFSFCENLVDVYITDMDAWCRIDFERYDATPMYCAENIYLNGNKIVSVEVPQDVTSLPYTFYGFKELIRVTIPDSVTRIGNSAFSGCKSLTSVTVGSSVTSIGEQAFYNCSSLMSITLPDSVKSIGSAAFLGCNSLISITLPDGVTSIENSTFSGCNSLTSIVIGSGVTSIGVQAFWKCSSLTDITIPDSVTSIGEQAFYECSSLTGITLPDGVTSIGYSMFYNCSSLTSITIPYSVTSIGSSAFFHCSNLASITLPNNVTSIGTSAFNECSMLISITLPDSVVSIGNEVFSGCSSLANVTLPDSVTSIGRYAFSRCRSLAAVYITDVAAWCRINFGNDFANPLYCAKNLYVNGAKAETLEIPESVQVISSNAFINAECIKRVALPKTLVGIAANAFSGCKNIEKVYYAGSESEWNALPISAGNDSLKNAQIYYNSTLDDYYCRIRVKVSDGGRIYVDRNTVEEGDTVTVTAVPYAGYELDAIYVDGAEIEGNTFTVTGNHEVSAAFTKLPAYGGTQDYRLEGITVQTTAGERLQELAREKLLVSVSIRHTQGTDGAAVMLAQYDAEGRYQGLVWLTLDEMPLNMALKVTLPVDNSDGKIVNLKAFVVGSILSPAPVGSAVSFGDV